MWIIAKTPYIKYGDVYHFIQNKNVQYVNELNWKVLNPKLWTMRTQMEKKQNKQRKKIEYAPNIYLPPFLSLSALFGERRRKKKNKNHAHNFKAAISLQLTIMHYICSRQNLLTNELVWNKHEAQIHKQNKTRGKNTTAQYTIKSQQASERNTQTSSQ